MASTWFSAPAPVARRVRAYFAPVNRATQTPVLFDPSEQGAFSLDAPPAPWISLGWIQNFARKPASKTAPLLTGIPAAPLEQVRETLAGASEFRISELDQADDGAGDRVAAHESACAGERRGSGCRWGAGSGRSDAAERVDGDIRSCWRRRMRRSLRPARSLRSTWTTRARRALWARRWRAPMCVRRSPMWITFGA